MAPESPKKNSSEIVQKALDASQDLTKEDLRKLSAKVKEMHEELKNKSQAELEVIRTDLQKEKNESEKDLSKNEKVELQKIEDKIDKLIEEKGKAATSAPAQTSTQHPKASPTSVSDIFVPKPKEQRTMMDTVKDYFKDSAIVGALVKGWIYLQKMIGGIFGGVDEKQLRNLEKLYGKFFGGEETRTWYQEYFKSVGASLRVVEGARDATAYATLKIEHQQKLRARAKEILPSFDDPATPPDAKKSALEAASGEITFESLLQEKADEYAKKYPDAMKNENAKTTITGIVRGQIPKVEVPEKKEVAENVDGIDYDKEGYPITLNESAMGKEIKFGSKYKIIFDQGSITLNGRKLKVIGIKNFQEFDGEIKEIKWNGAELTINSNVAGLNGTYGKERLLSLLSKLDGTEDVDSLNALLYIAGIKLEKVTV